MPTATVDQLKDLFIGNELEGSDTRRASLDLAELVVCNRVLSEAERNEATTHLLRKYGIIQLDVHNEVPVVNLVSPVEGSALNVPGDLALSAEASDTDGSILRVEFFRDATLLGVATQAQQDKFHLISCPTDQWHRLADLLRWDDPNSEVNPILTGYFYLPGRVTGRWD